MKCSTWNMAGRDVRRSSPAADRGSQALLALVGDLVPEAVLGHVDHAVGEVGVQEGERHALVEELDDTLDDLVGAVARNDQAVTAQETRVQGFGIEFVQDRILRVAVYLSYLDSGSASRRRSS